MSPAFSVTALTSLQTYGPAPTQFVEVIGSSLPAISVTSTRSEAVSTKVTLLIPPGAPA